ncbi:S-layer homology domain-containing protein [Wukongibacter sp. M2B1]|uniref:S-layer homology domain-containing protein n=1 Tax=Wukongibacter sp. M2B1 TaxID=3088895 RepID=UPI003D7A4BC7
MRKILSLVLVLSLVLGSMSFAFAATDVTADIEDESVKDAVKRLAAFGIVNGMDDGKYHPEMKVTREQFAKLVIEALGLGTAAEAAKGATQFADVEADRWSSGYVNTAIGQGVLKGYPDGTFKPTKEVTYGEAITMLVRALGYKDEFLPGSWPGNYVAKAAALDITDDVNFAPSGTADRGSVAVLVNNTLDAEVIKVDTYEGSGIKYEESDVTLLEDKLEIDKVEDIRVIATKRLDDKLDADQLTLLALEDDVVVDGSDHEEDDEFEVEFTDAINAEALVGLEITGYFDDDQLIYSEIETPKANYYRTIAYEDDDGGDDDGKMYLWETDEFYKFDSNVRIYINNEDRTDDIDWADDDDKELVENLWKLYADYTTEDQTYAYGNVVLEKGKVTFVDVAVFETISGIVEKVDEDEKIITFTDTYTSSANDGEELDLDKYDEFHVMGIDGSTMELGDLEKEDTFYFYEDANDDDKAYVLVKRAEVVTGELTKVRKGNKDKDQSRGKVYIDDKAYSLASWFAYTLDEMDSIESAEKDLDMDDVFDDVYKEDIKVVLDTKGRVALFSTDVDATTGNYAVIIKKNSGMDDELKLWTETGDTIKYDIDDYEDDLEYSDLDEGDIIEYDLEDDGTIDVIAKVYDAGDNEAVGGKHVKLVTLDDINKDNVEDDDNDNYYDQGDSLYIDYSEYKENDDNDEDDLDVLKWDDFKDLDIPSADSNNAVVALIVTDEDDDDEIELLAFLENYDEIADDDSYVGYLLNYDTDDDVMTVEVDVFGEGEKEYTVSDEDDQDDIKDHDFEELVVFVLRGGELKLKDFSYDDNEFFGDADGGKMWFKEKDGNKIIVYVGDEDTTDKFKYDSKVVVYNGDDKENINSLDKGDAIEFIVKEGEIIALKYTEEEDLDDGMAVEDGEVDQDVKDVEEMISDLPDVEDITLDDEDDVEEAREAYEDLSSSQQDKVDEDLLDELEAAEERIEELKDEEPGDVEFTFEDLAAGIGIGTRVVKVTLDTDNPDDYEVYVGDNELDNKGDGVFAGEVPTADASEDNVEVVEK